MSESGTSSCPDVIIIPFIIAFAVILVVAVCCMVSWQVWRCCREKSPEWEKEDNENRQKSLEQNEETEKLNGGDNGLDGEQSGGNEAINNQNSKSDFQKTLDPVRSTFESEKLLNQILDRRISAFVPTDDFYDDLPED